MISGLCGFLGGDFYYYFYQIFICWEFSSLLVVNIRTQGSLHRRVGYSKRLQCCFIENQTDELWKVIQSDTSR